MKQNTSSIDPLLRIPVPDDGISGKTSVNFTPVEDILSRTDGRFDQDRASRLQKLTSGGEKDNGRRFDPRKVAFAGAISVAALVGPLGGAQMMAEVVGGVGDKIDQNIDSHNLPPGGQPTEFVGGVAVQPGTPNTIVLPQVQQEP